MGRGGGMDQDSKGSAREGLTMAFMAVGAFGLALLAGFSVGKSGEAPGPAAVPREGPPPAPPEYLKKHADVAPPPAPEKPVSDIQPEKVQEAEAGAGEITAGLQLVTRAERMEATPGAEFTLTWKLINHLDRPVQYFDVRPSIVLKKPGFEQSYTAVGENLPPTADHVKTLAAKSTLTFTRTIEWPKRRRQAAPGWPNYAAPGPCEVRVGFFSENNARIAQQLKTEKGWDVYHERLQSATLTINVKLVGEDWEDEVKKTPAAQPADEEF